MKCLKILFCLMLLSVCAHAEDKKRLLLILKPISDNMLLQLKDDLARSLTGATISLYTHEEQYREYDITHTESGLANAKEAYEFLRFDESISYLNEVVSELKNNADSDNVLGVLRETYLYLAMDYLALDKETDAEQAIDDYLCISGQSRPDPVLYPPNLISLVDRQKTKEAKNLLTITITTTPSDAVVFIDDNKTGNSPVSTRVYPCSHFIRISRHACITKEAVFKVSNDAATINFDLTPDPDATEDMTSQKEQMIGMLNTYKADKIVILSTGKTQTANWITISTITAHTLATSSTAFIYTDEKQAVDRIIRFIQPDTGKTALHEILSVPMNTKKENTRQKTDKWYENKWLWTAGAAAIAGGIIFGMQEDHKSSSNTGSIAVKW